jgi:hypothetical protein
MKKEDLLNIDRSRMQNRRHDELIDNYLDLKEFIEGKNIFGPTRHQLKKETFL